MNLSLFLLFDFPLGACRTIKSDNKKNNLFRRAERCKRFLLIIAKVLSANGGSEKYKCLYKAVQSIPTSQKKTSKKQQRKILYNPK
jgi:hypothetical protein